MSEPHKAVFLSYAREDGDAALRIAEALRAAGVEVWLDQSELRGGDVWDTKIKKQIIECALFVPIVSANTQARKEGYFRREWRLAVGRTHDMSANVAFIVPVVIDATTQAAADVPEEFLRYQWTKLGGGQPAPNFIEQVRKLLMPPQRTEPAVAVAPVSARHGPGQQGPASVASPEVGRALPPSPRLRWAGPARPVWIAGMVAVILCGALGWFWLSRKDTTQRPNESAARRSAPPTSEQPASAKSIAVLPFTNMSEEKDSAFFTDGMHEDILTNLALIRELHVVSRTTAIQYRDTKKTLREIGRELGVAYILEGSVRRAGNKVRVTGQLIRAATDEHIWAKNYDRDLTDIFAIQSELSQAIAGELKMALSPQEQKLLNRRPTENIAAYDLFLKARDLRNTGGRSTAFFRQEEEWLNRAIQLDSNFAGAWAALAWTHSYQYGFNFDRSDARVALARAAIDHAVQLAADAPDVMLERGYYYYYCFRDYGRAAEIFRNLLQVQPNEAAVHNALASIYRRQGNWLEALQSFRRAAQLDPLSRDFVGLVVAQATAGRRYDEAMVEQQGWITRTSGDVRRNWLLAMLAFYARGSTREMEAFFAELNSVQPGSAQALDHRKSWAVTLGDYAEVVRLDKVQPYSGEEATSAIVPNETALAIGVTLVAQGDRDEARTRLTGVERELRARLEREPANARLLSSLGQIESVMGNKEAALLHVRKAMELEPESIDTYFGPIHRNALAFVYAWNGDKTQAIAEYARLLRTPYARINVYEMRKNPTYFPLHGDPRFEALLNDPKNNEPLF